MTRSFRRCWNCGTLCFKDWQDIAYSMHCTESNVFKVHSKALQAVKLPKLGSEFQ